jgi:hypothetical protein
MAKLHTCIDGVQIKVSGEKEKDNKKKSEKRMREREKESYEIRYCKYGNQKQRTIKGV